MDIKKSAIVFAYTIADFYQLSIFGSC